MKAKNNQKIQPDWWTKTFAGLFLGLSFAVAVGAIACILVLPYVERSLAPQIGMWTMPWVWMPMFFIAYIIPKGWQTLLIFALANIVAYLCLFALRG